MMAGGERERERERDMGVKGVDGRKGWMAWCGSSAGGIVSIFYTETHKRTRTHARTHTHTHTGEGLRVAG